MAFLGPGTAVAGDEVFAGRASGPFCHGLPDGLLDCQLGALEYLVSIAHLKSIPAMLLTHLFRLQEVTAVTLGLYDVHRSGCTSYDLTFEQSQRGPLKRQGPANSASKCHGT